MIILDTNVIAELMKPAPTPEVVDWLNEQPAAQLFLTAVTVGEISFGIEILPAGKRKVALENGFRRVYEAFSGRILPFDDEVALVSYGPLMAERRAIGRPLDFPDGQIAAIASMYNYAVATRNVRDFEDCGIQVINPFPA